MQAQLSTHQWLQIPQPVRVTLASLFGIKRSEGSFIEGNIVKSDGHTYHDLAVITVPAMQAYLLDTHETDFFRLFDRIVTILSNQDTTLDEAKAQATRRDLLMKWTKAIETIREESLKAKLEPEFTQIIKTVFIAGLTDEEIVLKKRGRPKIR